MAEPWEPSSGRVRLLRPGLGGNMKTVGSDRPVGALPRTPEVIARTGPPSPRLRYSSGVTPRLVARLATSPFGGCRTNSPPLGR
jgi:hypothetical protein